MEERVIKGPDIRRRHDAASKQELVERSLQPGASVSAIAQQHGINANLLFNWRRLHRRKDSGLPIGRADPELLPVVLVGKDAQEEPRRSAPSPSRTAAGVIEVDVCGARLRLRGAVDEANVRSVLAALMSAAK